MLFNRRRPAPLQSTVRSARRQSRYPAAEWGVCPARQTWSSLFLYVFFFAAAALAFAAFFLLLRIMTTPRKEPTTAEARRMRMTGMRTAQTRGGKKFWRGWSESTKGCVVGWPC